ncbi:HAD-IIIA family hydrolase [Sporolactobacillus shoreicorticis]|uniref:D,D-heptose 1,7-bisphosphate phosphatase n=1 Tax=Sporolactobacillus shoreicorticis TaxID=1923877 RepID=A0ABW5S3X8_9BACL|nr:HAD-IIIA family hydrolase [Sporolactobacillus shoreicorticis]MCO7125879.1 HAD-IIIA family hydrolase [Sporolactobacillus shoreicorticis]
MTEIQAVFIDRDGTIGGTGHFIHPHDFKPYTYSKDAIHLLKAHGIPLFACTNQWRISKSQAAMDDFCEEFRSYDLDGAFICPHGPDDGCTCRKPKPGLLLAAAKKYHLDLSKTMCIGDTGTDMQAAGAVGAKKILVRTGWGESSLNEYRHTWAEVEPDYIADNLLTAAQWTVSRL